MSPSAIAGILAALAYLLALQIRRVRDRVQVESVAEKTESDDMIDTFKASLVVNQETNHGHDH